MTTEFCRAMGLPRCWQKPGTRMGMNARSGITVSVQRTVESGVVYRVRSTSNLWHTLSNDWSDVGAPVTGPVDTVVVTNGADNESYYRVEGTW